MKNTAFWLIFAVFLGLCSHEFYTQSYLPKITQENSIIAVIKENGEKKEEKQKTYDYKNFVYTEH